MRGADAPRTPVESFETVDALVEAHRRPQQISGREEAFPFPDPPARLLRRVRPPHREDGSAAHRAAKRCFPAQGSIGLSVQRHPIPLGSRGRKRNERGLVLKAMRLDSRRPSEGCGAERNSFHLKGAQDRRFSARRKQSRKYPNGELRGAAVTARRPSCPGTDRRYRSLPSARSIRAGPCGKSRPSPPSMHRHPKLDGTRSPFGHRGPPS